MLTGARFALLAIALQLVLTFGHVHPLPSPVAAAQQIETRQDAPLGSDEGLAGDCAICASIAAFSTLDTPRAEPVRLPALVPAGTLRPHTADISVALSAFPPFNSRAPPSA